MDNEEPDEPRGFRTLCPTCSGSGVIVRPRLAVGQGTGTTVSVPEKCRPCDGTGWLPGLQAPV